MGGPDCKNPCGRRQAIKIFVAVLSDLGAVFAAAPAQAKSSKASSAYRGSPNGRQRCANCSWFAPPSGCGVVAGPVSANGWCNLWG
ncbi:high-potential iron-sulfur protein [Methylocystis parvus]|uniref:High-potential iron-sulfur protein n=1 Tax=Methylocystis parvus TaxID=134 RepID=A0A6B8M491_9HYPH|nr:high-potential iron-sulfur protein [Methylocystis parvus]QGM97175.1 iron oxidase [Methylocystis parvus]WBJ98921.1 high-potential iron-sulfur protein [Methylocystis parvus OBBP]